MISWKDSRLGSGEKLLKSVIFTSLLLIVELKFKYSHLILLLTFAAFCTIKVISTSYFCGLTSFHIQMFRM
jgi:hypothetical protein